MKIYLDIQESLTRQQNEETIKKVNVIIYLHLNQQNYKVTFFDNICEQSISNSLMHIG